MEQGTEQYQYQDFQILSSTLHDDKYLGRIDAHVKKSDGTNISSVMIKEKIVRKYNGGKRAGWCK